MTYDNESEHKENSVTFTTSSIEMLRVNRDGFWVRGVKVKQDDNEAEYVYNAFKQWVVWSELNKQ
jgi:hypothetical protein